MENSREPFHKTFRWIRGIFLKGEAVTRLECRHLQAATDSGRQAHRLCEYEGKELGGGPEEIASQIIEEATEDAKNFPGLQSYVIHYYTEKGGAEVRGRHVFAIAGSLSTEDDFSIGSTEPANEKGLMSQLMRHNEAKERATNANHASQIHFYETRLSQQDKYLSVMMDKAMHLFQLINDVEDRKMEREIEYRKMMRQEKTKDLAMQKLTMYAPVLMHKLLGPDAELPTGSSAPGIDPRMMALLESFTEEQMHKHMEAMTDEQKVAFMEIYMSYKEAKEKEKETKNAAE